jgi:hypothetical protein
MRKFSTLLFLVLAVAARAASLDFDLGKGLAYHRIHQLPVDLPTAEAARLQPCVLDLRYVTGDAAAAAALAAWLKFHATARAPVFILANSATSSALVAPLATPRPGASIVVIGGAAPGFSPDLALKISPDVERRAYDALEHGTALETLITEATDKPRNDEAKLAKDRALDPAPVDEPRTTSSAESEKVAKPSPPAPLIDAALQRAVQLHRTMLALKKL